MIEIPVVAENVIVWAEKKRRPAKGGYGTHEVKYDLLIDMVTIRIKRGDLNVFRALTFESLLFHPGGWRPYVAMVIRDMRRSLKFQRISA